MSRMNRTRSIAAGVEAPQSEAMAGEGKGCGAAAAAKSRHSRSLLAQSAATQQTDTDETDLKRFASDGAEQSQDLLDHQHSLNENAFDCQADGAEEQSDQAAAAQPDKTSLPRITLRTRSLPPKAAQPKSNRTGKAAKATTAAEPAMPAEHLEHSQPTAEPNSNPLSSTLAGLAQSLAASRQRRAVRESNTADALEQIDLAGDFANESGDSDFDPGNGSNPEISDVEVIDLSQEDPLDVVAQPNGLLSIRSPQQAAAVAEGSGTDDDEEEFQQLAGRGKRKQPAKAAAGERLSNTVQIQ